MSTSPSSNRVALLGLALLLAIAAGTTAVLAAFTGHFSRYDIVYADVPASGSGISSGSVVIFRDITVGTVAGLGQPRPDGVLRAELHITPGDLAAIPSQVKADVEIATVFGTQGINLVPPAHQDASHLATRLATHLAIGQVIPSVNRSQTTTLQGDATDLDNVLNALQPAALSATLHAVSTALAGNGVSIGRTIHAVAHYMGAMLPELPTLEHDIHLAAPAEQVLSTVVPPLVSAASNGAVTAQTISSAAAALHQDLVGGTSLAGQLQGLVGAAGAPYDDLVANSAPLLGDVAANPDEIAQILSGLDSWSKAFATAESQGPYLSFAGDLDIEGSVQVVLAALGLPDSGGLVMQGLGPANFNPATYTAADCPTYTGEQGRNCPAASTTTRMTTLVTTQSEERSVGALAAGLDGGKRPPSSAVATLLLEPILASMAGAL